jgi:hypothetical protein
VTEDHIERLVEKQTDSLDAQLMKGTLSQKDYDKAMRDLSEWAAYQYKYKPKGAEANG